MVETTGGRILSCCTKYVREDATGDGRASFSCEVQIQNSNSKTSARAGMHMIIPTWYIVYSSGTSLWVREIKHARVDCIDLRATSNHSSTLLEVRNARVVSSITKASAGLNYLVQQPCCMFECNAVKKGHGLLPRFVDKPVSFCMGLRPRTPPDILFPTPAIAAAV